jgi:hypothetical protein
VAQVAVEKLREKIEITPALTIEKINTLGPVEIKDRVLPLLDRPGKQDVLAG